MPLCFALLCLMCIQRCEWTCHDMSQLKRVRTQTELPRRRDTFAKALLRCMGDPPLAGETETGQLSKMTLPAPISMNMTCSLVEHNLLFNFSPPVTSSHF
eukprot:s4368_g4.t1